MLNKKIGDLVSFLDENPSAIDTIKAGTSQDKYDLYATRPPLPAKWLCSDV